jgi:thiazole synthase
MTTPVLHDVIDTLDTPFTIGGREFKSRLMVGTGKYMSNSQMLAALEASGAEVVTVAVRRVDLERNKAEGILSHLSPERYFLLANTAGCFNADDAIRYARLARATGFNEWVMLEVIGDQQSLLPDIVATVEATRVLAAEGFRVMAFTNDDLIAALRLEDAGAACVMPFASPMGSGLGLLNPFAIRAIRHRLHIPVIVNGGMGTASDAAVTMEQGVDGILVNAGIASASDPVRMAAAMRLAVDAGRLAYLAGRMPRREVAVPSAPNAWMIGR